MQALLQSGFGVGEGVGVGVGVGVPSVKVRAWQVPAGDPSALGLLVGAVGATDSFLNW